MRFASLGSGSRGNATLIEAGDSRVMVDCGFSIRETERRLARFDCEPGELNAILVTHEHGDHVNGVTRFARKHSIPVWVTSGTLRSNKLAELPDHLLHIIDIHSTWTIGDIQIEPFPVPHDALEPCQFVFSDGQRRIGLLTDTGMVTPHICAVLSGVDSLLLECNHDTEMLRDSSYAPVLKERIASNYGHMSNEQAAGLLAQIDCNNLQHLVAMHLSEENNTHDAVRASLNQVLQCGDSAIEIAGQDDGLYWRRLD